MIKSSSFLLTTPFPKLSPHNIQRFIFYSFRLISLTLLVADLLCTLDTPVGKTSTQVAAILGFEHILWWIGDAFIDAFDCKKVLSAKEFLWFLQSHMSSEPLFANYQFLRFFLLGLCWADYWWQNIFISKAVANKLTY